VRIPFSSAAATISNVVEAAAMAETEGYHGVVTGDHIDCSLDRHLYHRMGRGVLGEVGSTEVPNFFESLTTLSFLAGKFPSLELAVGVMLIPIREPLLLAKQIANLDAFSHGRVSIGIGIGNATDKKEFDLMHMKHSFSQRWDLAKEYVEAMKESWTKPTASYNGRFVKFDGATIYPKPARKPHPPLWVGGHSEMALKLGAALCNGWIAGMLTPEEYANERVRFLDYAKDAGRGSEHFDFGTMTRVSIDSSKEDAIRNLSYVTSGHKATAHLGAARAQYRDDQTALQKMNLKAAAGSPSEVLKRIEDLVEAGVNFFDLYFMYPELGLMLKQMKLFAREVLPSFN